MADTTYVRSLASGHTKYAVLTALPADPTKATLTELQAGIDAACRITSDSTLGATDDNTVNDPALCDTVSADVPTTSKYDGTWNIFRYFDATTKNPETGVAGDIGDGLFAAMKELGTTLYIAKRQTGKLSTDAWTADDPYELYEVMTGTPQDSDGEGYIKKSVKLYVQRKYDGAVPTTTP